MIRLGAVALLASILVAAFVMPSPARASTNGDYVGVTTDFADFKMTVQGGVTGLEIGVPNAEVPFPCFTAGTITLTDPIEILTNTIRGGQSDREFTDTATGQPRRLRLSGRLGTPGSPQDGIATGSVSILAVGPDVEGVICNPRSFGWAAVLPMGDQALTSLAKYRGTISAGQSFEGLTEGGAASFAVAADGASITNLVLAPPQECAGTDLGASTAAVTNKTASFHEEAKGSTAIPVVAKYRVAVTGDRALGVFYIDRNKAGCRPLGGFFVATPTVPVTPLAPVVSPTPTPSPAAPSGATARISSGSIPPAGGIGLIVWGGGSSEQLLTASTCPRASAAFWASNASGEFEAYIPGAAVAVVNAAWNTRFPTGIPAGTALLGRCA